MVMRWAGIPVNLGHGVVLRLMVRRSLIENEQVVMLEKEEFGFASVTLQIQSSFKMQRGKKILIDRIASKNFFKQD